MRLLSKPSLINDRLLQSDCVSGYAFNPLLYEHRAAPCPYQQRPTSCSFSLLSLCQAGSSWTPEAIFQPDMSQVAVAAGTGAQTIS